MLFGCERYFTWGFLAMISLRKCNIEHLFKPKTVTVNTIFNTTHKWIVNLSKLSFLAAVLALGACASTPPTAESAEAENDFAAVAVEEDNGDRFESFNRAVFKFNMTADRWLIRPVAKGYDYVLPDPVQSGVGNFFDNLKEVSNIVNDGLQWKWGQAANDSGRLLINSTIGVLGVFDVARKMGMEKSDGETFTQTLAKWGVPRGPYLVLPVLGSNTLRGTVGLPVEWKLSPTSYVEPFEAKMGIKALEQLHVRAELLATEELASGDFYTFVREAYLQRLEYLENDGKVEDSFGDDFGDDEYGF